MTATDPSPLPILDLSAEVAELWEDLNRELQAVLKSGSFILGPWVGELEKKIAAYLGVKHAVAMNSGTDALVIGLRALGVQPGDEVIVPPFTFFATAEAVSLIGATPVFVDVDVKTMNMDPAKIAAAITAKTKVIVPVHLFGHAADLDPILKLARERKLKVLEDTAQAFGGAYKGKKVGGIGEAGALSFYPTKNLGAYGDAGMFVTRDDAVADAAKMLRVHGSRQRYHNEAVGYNSRMDSFQGAVLGIKLPHLDRWNDLRRQWAGEYSKRLTGVKGITPPTAADYTTHVYHQYTIRVASTDGTAARRDGLVKFLGDRKIGSMIYYPIPVHKLEVYAARKIVMPNAELLGREVMSLPIWPQMKIEQVERVCGAIGEYAGS